MTWNTNLTALDEGCPVSITILRADGSREVKRAWAHPADDNKLDEILYTNPEDEEWVDLLKPGDTVVAWHEDDDGNRNGLEPYDPAKPVTDQDRIKARRSQVLQKVQQAQALLLEAYQLAVSGAYVNSATLEH